MGLSLSVHAFVALGSLSPDDVSVQLVHGRANADDELTEASFTSLFVGESYDGGRFRFDGDVTLARAGAFGYTVRVVPHNDLLISPAELGVVAMA